MLSCSDFESMGNRIRSIASQDVKVVRDTLVFPPTLEELEDSNTSYELYAAVLFIDIRHSTRLVEKNSSEKMVKIYRIFMRTMVECVRKNGGVTRQFLGDRIMGIFKCDDNKGACDKAFNAARDMHTAVDFVINRCLSENFDGQMLACGIGIDFGKILVTKVGMHGLENDCNRENELDYVWVGNVTNHASKFADLAKEGQIFVSRNFYKKLTEANQGLPWKEQSSEKGDQIYYGYGIFRPYSDCAEKMDSPLFPSFVSQDSLNPIVEGVKAIEGLQNALINRERELAIEEAHLLEENGKLQEEFTRINDENRKLRDEKKALKNRYSDSVDEYYKCLVNLVGSWHCSLAQYKEGFQKDLTCEFYISELYRVGNKAGKSDMQITSQSACGLMEMYVYLNKYEKAYGALLVMAKTNSVWVNLKPEILSWAKDNLRLTELIDIIKNRLDQYDIPVDQRKDFAGYLNQIIKIRGY